MNARVKYAFGNLAIALCYFVTGTLGLSLHAIGGIATLLWAPSAIGLAVVLLYGLKWIPGIALGTFVVLASRGVPVTPSLVIVISDLAEVWLGSILLIRVLHFRPELDRVRDVIVFVVVAFVISLLSVTATSVTLFELGRFDATRAADVWARWVWSHFSGDLIIAPAILTCVRRSRAPRVKASRVSLEVVTLIVTSMIVVLLVLGRWLPPWLPGAQAPYYLLPFLLWAGIRFGPRGAAIASLGASVIAIIAQSFGLGPFQRLFELQSFIAIATISTLMLSALTIERLRAVERKGAIQMTALDAIITINKLGHVVELNPAAERMFEIREREVLGKDLAALIVPPRLRDAYHRGVRKYVSGPGGTSDQRYRAWAWRARDNTEFPVEIAITRVPVESEVLVTGFIRDVTAEHRAETAWRDANAQLERKVAARTADLVAANLELERHDSLMREAEKLAHLGSFDFDLTTKKLKWSDELFEIYGRDVNTFQPSYWSFLEAVHPDDRMLLQSRIERATATKKPFGFEERIIRPDGSLRILQTQARIFVDDKGLPIRLAGCCQDITERKQADAVRSRLVQLVESSADAMISLSPAGHVETWNAAASKMFGYSAQEAIGKPCTELVPTTFRSDVRALVEAVRKGERLPPYEVQYVRKDGSLFEASVTASAVYDECGQVVGISKVLRDVTDKKRVETQIRESLDEKEVLLREIHHRVKNNLQVVSSLLSIQVSQEHGEAARKGLIESQNRIQSMALVHQLLYQSTDISKIDADEYLTQLTKRLVETYNVAPERIGVHVYSSPLMLDIDRAIPCGLIVNELVTNALTHAFPDERRGQVWVALEQHANLVTLTVADDGIGIAEPIDFARVETFGLRIAYTLSKQLDGTISLLRSHGTTVRLEFPVAAHQLDQAA
ncbi:MAG TPA: PAS domain S-box protein [Kofleriaceae bacterium]